MIWLTQNICPVSGDFAILFLPKRFSKLDPNQTDYLHCKVGK